MKHGFVKSSPRFFLLIRRSGLLFAAALLLLAPLVPAPLQEAANPALTPNPAKSAWFLLWIQELVSWSRLTVYPVLAGAVVFLLLPWVAGTVRLHRASWFPREQRAVTVGALLAAVVVLALTGVAMFLRGANWSFGF